MLTLEQIENNKNRFVELINSINIEGADIEGLITYLSESDFFYAPASTQYNCSYDGGLCEHSLHVYEALVDLVAKYAPNKNYSEDTLKIVGLLHDIAKIGFYEQYSRNVKVGNKWESVLEFRVKDVKERDILGSKGLSSFLTISKYLPLNKDEIIAIANQYDGTKEVDIEMKNLLSKCQLVVLLHTADVLSCYCTENTYDGKTNE